MGYATTDSSGSVGGPSPTPKFWPFSPCIYTEEAPPAPVQHHGAPRHFGQVPPEQIRFMQHMRAPHQSTSLVAK